jgi:alpha-tubulin suppressor-like RCC1 family protein
MTRRFHAYPPARAAMLSGMLLAAMSAPSLGDGQVIGWGSDQFGERPPLPATVLPFRKAAAGTAHTVALRADGAILCFGLRDDGRCDVPAGLGPWKAVSAGGAHTAAVRVNGMVACWGSNGSLQCDVPASLGACRDVAAGGSHTLALRLDQAVVAWGGNGAGQSNVPEELGLCTAIAAGGSHSVALRVGGSVMAWGSNAAGQCDVPAGLPQVQAIAAGGSHTVVLRQDGIVVCWGGNGNGQCSAPPGLGGCIAIAAGTAHSAAVKANGSLVAWGSDSYGQSSEPAGLGACSGVAAGGGHTVALRADGDLECFGAGRFDTGQTPDYGQSRPPADLGSVVRVAGGGFHALGLRADGRVVGWGSDTSGQASPPAGLSSAVAVAAGAAHSVALRADGSVLAWGDNAYGQANVPVTLGPFTAVSAHPSGNHSVARRAVGSPACWGSNSNGQCAVPAGLVAVDAVAAGGAHSLALRPDGTVAGWGANAFGQCTPPAGLSDAVAIAGGGHHSVALRTGGAVACWGRNGNGQCTVPAGLGPCVEVAAGASHTVALRSDGTVAAWGSNSYGQSVAPSGLASVASIGASAFATFAVLDPEASSCGSSGAPGEAELVVSGSLWENVGVWRWSNSGPRVPGGQSKVGLGANGAVAAGCEARAGELTMGAGSSLLVLLDASVPGGAASGSVTVTDVANLSGRLWVLASGAATLPEGLNVPVISAGDPRGSFAILQSTLPAPPGKFLTLVPSAGLGGVSYSLQLRSLPSSGGGPAQADAAGFDGEVVAAETMDWDGQNGDDLALAITFGPNLPGSLQVLLNDGNGNLDSTNSVSRPLPPQPTCLAVGDLDDDGKQDAVVGFAAPDNTVRPYYNQSPSTGQPFAQGLPAQLGATPISVVVDDQAPLMPGDRNVVVGTSDNTVQTVNSGTGTTTASVSVPTTPSTSGKRGTVIVSGGATAKSFNPAVDPPGRLVVITQDPNGGLAVSQAIDVPAEPVLLDLADIDGDGKFDVVTANANPEQPAAGGALPVLTLFRGTQAGGLGGAVPIEPAGASAGLDVALVDFDDDGDRDIVSVHGTAGTQSAATVLRVDVDPQLPPGGPITIGAESALASASPVLCARGNLDGQGGDDLYLVDTAPPQFLMGGFPNSVQPFTGAAPPCASDLNDDGRVSGADLTVLLSYWGFPGPGDLDGDGVVSGADVGILFGDWGPCPGE